MGRSRTGVYPNSTGFVFPPDCGFGVSRIATRRSKVRVVPFIGTVTMESPMSGEKGLPPRGEPPKRPEIVDPNNVPVVFADWFVTAGSFEGVVNVVLGTTDHSMRSSNDEQARVIVAARLRLSHDFAARLHGILGQILGLPPSGVQAPPPPPAPPKNMIN